MLCDVMWNAKLVTQMLNIFSQVVLLLIKFISHLHVREYIGHAHHHYRIDFISRLLFLISCSSFTMMLFSGGGSLGRPKSKSIKATA